jgi:hypothetical protein
MSQVKLILLIMNGSRFFKREQVEWQIRMTGMGCEREMTYMNKMRLFVGGVCLLVNCAPAAFSQSSNQNGTTSNYQGLQNLVNSVNNSQTNPGAGSGAGAPRHRWQGGGGGWKGGGGAAAAGPTGSGLDAMGKGKNMDPEKVAERKARILKRFDTNGDGVLDDAEKAKWQAFKAERRAQREARMNGGGGPGAGLNGPGAGGSAGGGPGPGGAGGPEGPAGAGAGGPAGVRHRHRRMQNGGDNGALPGARAGGPGDFPSGFPGAAPGGPGGSNPGGPARGIEPPPTP